MTPKTAGGNTPRPVLAAHELHLDVANHSALLGGSAVQLRPKSFALLHYLMQHPGQLVPKEELISTLWPDTQVSPSALKVCIREVRQALGDDATSPRFIRTVGHGLGYWFIPAVAAEHRLAAPVDPSCGQLGATPELIGRAAELARLREHLMHACAGTRQLVFVTGEAGSGKTALVRALLDELRGRDDVRSAIGWCNEPCGDSAGEAYLPLREALGELCQKPDGETVRETLRRHAPTWLQKWPAWLAPADPALPPPATPYSPPERLLPEMAAALEALTREKACLLVLEDLHCSDKTTVDLLAYLGRRRQPARLLILGLFRPDEALQTGHPVTAVSQDLHTQRCCKELLLPAFQVAEVATYLEGRLVTQIPTAELAAAIWRRTQGNPLFVTSVVEELTAHGPVPEATGAGPPSFLDAVEQLVPQSLRRQLEHPLRWLLPEEQRILEAASVVGEEFTAVTAAAAAQLDGKQADELCERLASLQSFIVSAGLSELPDGTVSGRYRFKYVLGQQTLSHRVGAARRVQYHRRIAQQLERAYGDRTDDIAEVLALHLAAGHVPKRAIHYLQRAARHLTQDHENRAAAAVLSRALALLPQVPEADREILHFLLREQRGLLYRSTGDVPAARDEFLSMAAVSQSVGETRGQLRALLYVADQLSGGDTERCLEAAQQALAVSEAAADADARLQARGYLGHVRATRRHWSAEDADACVAAAQAARLAPEGVLAWSSPACHLLVMRSAYGAADALVPAGLVRAQRVGDVAEYLSLQLYGSASLCEQGKLGMAIDMQRRGLEIAEKHQHHVAAGMLRVGLARAYEQACAFAKARDVATQTLAFAQQDLPARQTLLQLSQCVLGSVYRELGAPEQALHQLQAIPAAAGQNLTLAAWRSYALSECWLALGKTQPAIEEAGRLIAMMTAPGNRTLLALGRRVCARAEAVAGRWQRAEAELSQAGDILAAGDRSVAMWRVLASTAAVHRHAGREAAARQCLAQSAALLLHMADGLRSHEGVRQDLLSNAEVRAILAAGELQDRDTPDSAGLRGHQVATPKR